MNLKWCREGRRGNVGGGKSGGREKCYFTVVPIIIKCSFAVDLIIMVFPHHHPFDSMIVINFLLLWLVG